LQKKLELGSQYERHKNDTCHRSGVVIDEIAKQMPT
jgi:hypothetical protein